MAAAANPTPDMDENADPEKWLESGNHQVIKARINGLESLEEVRAYVSYEVRHKDRKGILELLQYQANELRNE